MEETTPQTTSLIPQEGFAVLDFWAEWCGPCKLMAPILEEIKKEYADKIAIVEIDVDQHEDLRAEYEIMSVPTYIFMHNGKAVDQIVGAKSKDVFAKKIDEVIAANTKAA